MQKLQEFKAYLKKIQSLQHAATLLHWDMECSMPKNGVEAHIASLTLLSSEAFKLSVASEMEEYIEALSKPEVFETLSAIDKKMVTLQKEAYDKSKHIPLVLQERLTELKSRAQHVWMTAKYEDDFDTMVPYFEEMVQLLKEKVQYTHPGQDAYDALLGSYEKGMTADKIAKVFEELKAGIIPLIQEIASKPVFDDSKCLGEYPKGQQQALSLYLLNVIGYNFDSGVLGESEHPFTLGSAPYDVRITTHYHEDDIRQSAFSILHEGGHALYEQHINPELVGTTLNDGTSMGIHESQSRFYENIIGRSEVFWQKHYSEIIRLFPQYETITQEAFYQSINKVGGSLIRVDADELTYNLHVIIRFELERALFDGSLAVKDLPQAWNEKMQAYLGVQPTSHKEGVLQDVHWPGGMFGYFPSYALGNIYSGQFLQKMEEELGRVEDLLQADQLEKITAWLSEHIHQYGKMKTPAEIIKDTCGTEVDAQPIIAYYKKKYSKLYGLKTSLN